MDNNLRQRVAVLIDPVFETDKNRVQVATIRELLAEAESTSARVAELEAEADRWRIAMENLTPGGSEYHRDLERCVATVRDRMHRGHTGMIEAVKMRRDAEARVAELEAALNTKYWEKVRDENTKSRARVAELEQQLAEARRVIEDVGVVALLPTPPKGGDDDE